MTLITTQGFHMHDTQCCTGQCNQGRACQKVIQLHPFAEKRRWFAPMKDIVVDFAAFWDLSRLNWWGVFTLTIIPASFGAAVMAVYWGGKALGAW